MAMVYALYVETSQLPTADTCLTGGHLLLLVKSGELAGN
jgi:hypothetical protein